ncbi:hypothetical protein D3C77_383580 [compost metagenome]
MLLAGQRIPGIITRQEHKLPVDEGIKTASSVIVHNRTRILNPQRYVLCLLFQCCVLCLLFQLPIPGHRQQISLLEKRQGAAGDFYLRNSEGPIKRQQYFFLPLQGRYWNIHPGLSGYNVILQSFQRKVITGDHKNLIFLTHQLKFRDCIVINLTVVAAVPVLP